MSLLSPAAAAARPILIVGGGGGGLTLALTLHRAGIPSRVVMKDSSLSASGGAVILMSGASRILDRLGLGSRVRSIGLPATRGEVYLRSGKRLFGHDLEHDSLLQVSTSHSSCFRYTCISISISALHRWAKFSRIFKRTCHCSQVM
jgi:2-polyprenyl-6-methoxyphenol hydroxylase-like FAD-dependent oxidoreductase